MSRAFVKEDDAGEPPLIPPRAALPAGIPNYVTPRGLALLRKELEELETERTKVEANREDEANRSRQLSILNGRRSDLNARIASAKVIEPQEQQPDAVRFGATVSLKTIRGGKPGTTRTFKIVGVDEASVTDGLIAFVAPIAKAVSGARVGQTVTLRLGRSEEEVQVTAIAYEQQA
ncbi:transcription elongation factor GreAB [Pontibacter qinzhouensis]|uniref:Transcription elongation factor GreAB n=1 Tax=Pontibacter qinzhouensis TaxID=2603253 RepID=A0A5C8KE45_9BACT|nr:GreA/GreB family elongation factor [Pontibacter qinzhouensis]TXK50271.1 transcription elongation factor GreAB [Pontibacter qinzhouensis]